MGTETTSATYRRTQTHESQSFSTELLEPKELTANIWHEHPKKRRNQKNSSLSRIPPTQSYNKKLKFCISYCSWSFIFICLMLIDLEFQYLSGKVLQEVGTNAQVSGMCLLHADTSADLSKRERPLTANFSG